MEEEIDHKDTTFGRVWFRPDGGMTGQFLKYNFP
jgi:hypothetical protein